MTARLVTAGTLLAVAGAGHAVVNTRLLRRADVAAGRRIRPVPVLVPARDEAARIGECVRSLAGQAGVAEVVVLDDCSQDATAKLARAAGARVIAGSPPPPGWLGKPWACAQLTAATGADAGVLVFVDADVRVDPDGVRAAVDLLERAGFDVACPFPRQEAHGRAERLIQPLLQWSWLTWLPLRAAERTTRPSLTAACGQFVVVRRAALERAGGWAALRAAVLDDLALVRAVKASGGRGGVVDGSDLARCRMYEGWPALRDGYSKSLWAAFGTPPRAAGVLTLLVIAYVLPPLAALRGSRVGLVGYAAAVASRAVAARRTGGRAWPDALAHPLSIVAVCALTVRSHVLHRRGALRWRGRRLPA